MEKLPIQLQMERAKGKLHVPNQELDLMHIEKETQEGNKGLVAAINHQHMSDDGSQCLTSTSEGAGLS